jgi:diguanylate cyclase (GGDEF)-like protein/PAS domain S-box-containing protein
MMEDKDGLSLNDRSLQSPELWASVVAELTSPAGALELTLRRLSETIGATLATATVIFVRGADGVLDPVGVYDTDPQRAAGLRDLFTTGRPAVGEGLLGQVAATASSIYVGDIESVPQETRFSAYRGYAQLWELNSFLGAPITANGEVLGVLGLSRHGDHPQILPTDQEFAERLATALGAVIRLAGVVEEGRVASAALNAISDAVVATDEDLRLTFWNERAESMFGFERNEVLGRPLARVLTSTSDDQTGPKAQIWDQQLGRVGDWSVATRLSTKSGSPLEVEVSCAQLPHPAESESIGMALVLRPMGEARRARVALERQEKLAQAALDASPMMSAVVSDNGLLIAASRAWVNRMGRQWGVGARLRDAVGAVLGNAAQAAFDDQVALTRVQERARHHADYEVEVDGESRTFSVHSALIPDVGVSITIADITDRASRERALSYEATHDPLTGLPNRAVLMDRAEHGLNLASRNEGRVGLIFCDLDDFKSLNDQYGHDIGDDVLEEFGTRLLDSCRVTDTVARLHGDEFAILVEGSVDEFTVPMIADRVVKSMVEPFEVAIGQLSATSSVGAVIFAPEPGRQSGLRGVEEFLRRADVAMYEAKDRGRNQWVLYNEQIQDLHNQADVLALNMYSESEIDDFGLHMQPQFDTAGALVGAEALLRWRHPERGLVEPFDLLRTGISPHVGDWTMRQAVSVLADWGPLLPNGFRLGVNLSRSQWLDQKTSSAVMGWCEEMDVPLSRLRLEVSQESLAADVEWSVLASQMLAEIGVEIAVNDFGMGAARLSDLARPTIHSAQIGRRVVRDAGSSDAGRRLAVGCGAMAHAMGWRVIATGVETAEQLQAMRWAGSETLQGFLLGRPVPHDDFKQLYLESPATG